MGVQLSTKVPWPLPDALEMGPVGMFVAELRMLHKEANVLFAAGHFEEANDAFQEALEMAKKVHTFCLIVCSMLCSIKALVVCHGLHCSLTSRTHCVVQTSDEYTHVEQKLNELPPIQLKHPPAPKPPGSAKSSKSSAGKSSSKPTTPRPPKQQQP